MSAKKKTTAKPGDAADGLTKQVNVRLSEADYARLEAMAVHLSVATIVRVALLFGLDVIEKDPGLLLGAKPKRRA